MVALRRPQQLAQAVRVHCKRYSSKQGSQWETRSSSSRRLLPKIGASALGGALLYATVNTALAETSKAQLYSEEDFGKYSQDKQVRISLTDPGCYAFGNNKTRVASPATRDDNIKEPTRIKALDRMPLRDLILDERGGVAVNDQGDVVQWGHSYFGVRQTPGKKESFLPETPEITLRGRNIVKVALTADSIVALSKPGKLYRLPISGSEQSSGEKVSETSWIPFWPRSSLISYNQIEVPSSLKVVDIVTGDSHLLCLTNTGKVFSAITSEDGYDYGQAGLFDPLRMNYQPEHLYKLNEIDLLKDMKIGKIAAGSRHSIVVDTGGRAFSFGNNTFGQLGVEYNPQNARTSVPIPVPLMGRIRDVYAGGDNSYFVVEELRDEKAIYNVYASGTGLCGQLGNGNWTQSQGTPSKVRNISGLSEYNEALSKVQAIPIKYMSVSKSHCAAVLDNATNLENLDKKEEGYGTDVFVWGDNKSWQQGNRKRNNVALPSYIPPLDSFLNSETSSELKKVGRFGLSSNRLHLTPPTSVRMKRWDGKEKNFLIEQVIVCGNGITAVYPKIVHP